MKNVVVLEDGFYGISDFVEILKCAAPQGLLAYPTITDPSLPSPPPIQVHTPLIVRAGPPQCHLPPETPSLPPTNDPPPRVNIHYKLPPPIIGSTFQVSSHMNSMKLVIPLHFVS